MQPNITDGVAFLSIGLSVTITAEPIKMPLEWEQGNHVLHVSPDPQREGEF